MPVLDYSPTTKRVEFSEDSLVSLNETDRRQAEQSIELINKLMSDLVSHNEDFPSPAAATSKVVSQSASNLVNNGVKSLSQKKYAEAHKVLRTALETVLRRPLWESVVTFFEEVAKCLAPLCDCDIALGNYADAYAELSLLLLLKPTNPQNHYRKGLVLHTARRYADAKEYFRTAYTINPANAVYKKALEAMN